MSRSLNLTFCILVAIAVHALIFVGSAAWLRSFGSVDVGAVAWSHQYYYDYASQALSGKLPYRDFAFEYPILSFPLFLFPRLLVSDFESYRIAFMAEMFLFDIAAVVLIAVFGDMNQPVSTVARRLGWYTLYCFLLGPLVIGRFELAPMVVAFAAACSWFSGRRVLGGVMAGVGTLMKVFPGVVAMPALIQEAALLRTRKPRGTAAFLFTMAVGLAIWTCMGGSRVIESLGYHAERGLEIGSLFGGAVMLAGTMSGREVPVVFDHNAYHVAPEYGASLARLTFPLQAAALILVMWRFRRSGMTDSLRFSAAAVLAFVVFGKVLSPQYLIWLFPFLAVLDGRTGSLSRRIFLICCLTTTLIYPGPGFSMILDHQAPAILLLGLRNALLLGLLAVLLWSPEQEATDPDLTRLRIPGGEARQSPDAVTISCERAQ